MSFGLKQMHTPQKRVWNSDTGIWNILYIFYFNAIIVKVR